MEIVLIILVLFSLSVISFCDRDRKPEVLLDCSNKICKWNNDQPCPYGLIRYRSKHGCTRRVKDSSMSCCKIRQQRMLMGKMIVNGDLASNGQQILDDAQKSLDNHKKDYPEEHKHLFG